MTLRSRIFYAVLAVAVVLVGVATLLTRHILAQSYREDYAALRVDVDVALTRELALRRQLLGQVADAVAQAQHPLMAATFARLEQKLGALDEGDRRALAAVADASRVALGVDELVVIGHDQRIIVASGRPELVGELAGALGQRADLAQATTAFGDDLGQAGQVRTIALRAVQEGAYLVTIFVARWLDESLLQTISRPGLVVARLVASDGRVLLGASPLDGQPPRVPTVSAALLNLDGTAIAQVHANISDQTLSGVLARLSLVALGASLGALLLAAGLATWLSRRVTHRLDELVAAANAVAGGDLSRRVAADGHDELAGLAAAFNHMVAQVNQGNERVAWAERRAAWQDIARHLAHEIKNPLTPIQMSMDTLRKSYERGHPQFAEILAESTQTVLQEAARLKKFATEFGNFARLPRPVYEQFDLTALAKGLAAMRGNVEFEAPPEPIMISADRDQLSQVLHNLLDNAADAVGQAPRPQPPRITLSLSLEAGSARLAAEGDAAADAVVMTVADNGIGLSAEVRAQLFTPYVTSKLDRGGTGLGLAIVHRIVTEHGGTIEAPDVPLGTTFVVCLPLVAAAPASAT
ncbi:MAG: HAMP domain-containing protein [Myxococcales bacterium]|nr:HAMP domain-containing protein [Myxococcales bacterium]